MAGSTPIYGFPYPQSTDLVADYPTLGQELATDVETVISGLGSGLNIMTATSIANSGGTATRTNGQVTFSGVSSVSLNGVFTSTYDNYRIMLYITGSTTAVIQSRLRASGTDASGANYTFQELKAESTTVSGARSTSQTFAQLGYAGTAEPNVFAVDVFRPQLAAVTGMRSTAVYGYLGATIWDFAASHSLTTAYDGISIIPNTGTISGTIRVYGYKNS